MSTTRPGRFYLKNCLRAVWVLVTLWYELGIFHRTQKSCLWPDSSFPEKSTVTHVLVVADPQIIDYRSYPDRNFASNYLTQLIVDLNLRRNWQSALRSRPDVVLFLGDMMDGGRVDMSDYEYERLFRRFTSIFQLDDRIPRYTIPGNHDVGLGKQDWFSLYAHERYVSHFGPLNRNVDIGNYTFVMLDAAGLVEEDYQRYGRGISYEDWKATPGGTINYVKSFAERFHHDKQVILLNHIPLSRPEGSYCGPLREKGTIHRGVGIGYQNTLGKHSTRFLLENLKPVLVLSGDDHDYCDYLHVFPTGSSRTLQTREITVKSLSMAMGIHQPGYQLLSLASIEGSSPTFMDLPCILPDQVDIYLSAYVPLLVLSLLCVFAYHVKQRCYTSRHHRARPGRQRHTDEEKLPSPSAREIRQRLTGHSDDDYDYFSVGIGTDEELEPTLPTPVASLGANRASHRRRDGSCTCPMSSSPPPCLRKGTFLGEFLRDVRDVAVFPVAAFFIISCWTLMAL